MRFLIHLISFIITTSIFAQADSVKSSALLINYSSLHVGPPDFSPDTLQVEYDCFGNERSKILISRITESLLGTPIIYRSGYDSLQREVSMEAYAFNLETELPVSMKDTASARMDTIRVWYEYLGDTCKIETMEYISHLFGMRSAEKYQYYTYFDSLGREKYFYEVGLDEAKTKEKRVEYKDNLVITKSINKHSNGKIYSESLDTLFKDSLGISMKRKFYDDKEPKYNFWNKCGNCEHIYFKNDSSQIYKEVWQDYKGVKRKEILYDHLNDKIVSKTSRIFSNISKGDSIRVDRYTYDSFGNVTYFEKKKRNRVDYWQKVLIKYKARLEE